MLKKKLTLIILSLISPTIDFRGQSIVPDESWQTMWETNFKLKKHYHLNPTISNPNNIEVFDLVKNDTYLTIYGVNSNFQAGVPLWYMGNGDREEDVQVYSPHNISFDEGVCIKIETKKTPNQQLQLIFDPAQNGGVVMSPLGLSSFNWQSVNKVGSCSNQLLENTYSLNTCRKMTSIKSLYYNNEPTLFITTDGGGLSRLETCGNEKSWKAENGEFSNNTIASGFLGNLKVQSLNQNTNKLRKFYIGTSKGLYRSTNLQSWTSVSEASDDNIYLIERTNSSNNDLIVFRDNGNAYLINKVNESFTNLDFPGLSDDGETFKHVNCFIQEGNSAWAGCDDGLWKSTTLYSWQKVLNIPVKGIILTQNSIFILNDNELRSITYAFETISSIALPAIESSKKLLFDGSHFIVLCSSNAYQIPLNGTIFNLIYSCGQDGSKIVDGTIYDSKLWLGLENKRYPLHWYSSGNIISVNDNSFPDLSASYGRIEARVKLNDTYGLFPAFWTWKQSGLMGEPGWDYEEIDIFEMVPGLNQNCLIRGINNIQHDRTWSTSNLHTFYNDYIEETCSLESTEDWGRVYKLTTPPNGTSYTNYKTYAVEWSLNKIRWLINDQVIREELNPDMDANGSPDYTNSTNVILNQAVSGFVNFDNYGMFNPSIPNFPSYYYNTSYSGPYDLNNTPGYMEIESVRYLKPKYKCSTDFILNSSNFNEGDDCVYRTITTSGIIQYSMFSAINHWKANTGIILNENFEFSPGAGNKTLVLETINCD